MTTVESPIDGEPAPLDEVLESMVDQFYTELESLRTDVEGDAPDGLGGRVELLEEMQDAHGEELNEVREGVELLAEHLADQTGGTGRIEWDHAGG